MIKRAASAMALFALASCSQGFEITPVFADGRLTFISSDDRDRSYPGCVSDFEVANEADGRPVWAFSLPLEQRRDLQRCPSVFPAAYAIAPSGARVTVQPQRPSFDTLYTVNASGGGSLHHGKFRLVERDGNVVIETFPR